MKTDVLVPRFNKTQSPPEGEPFLETSNGLKFWSGSRKFKPGLSGIVETEDSSISMECYQSGGREDYGSFLFRWKRFRIGFVCHEFLNGYPAPPLPNENDFENGVFIKYITAVGTPVYNAQARAIVGENGEIIRKYGKTGVPEIDWSLPESANYLTGISWTDYANGQFEKFESRAQQNDMLTIWVELFEGMQGKLAQLRRASDKKGLSPEVRFTDAVLEQFERGDLIASAGEQPSSAKFGCQG